MDHDRIDDPEPPHHPHSIYDAAYQYCCSSDGGSAWNETVFAVEGATTDDDDGEEHDANDDSGAVDMIDIIEDWSEDVPLFQHGRPCLIRDGPRLQHCFAYPRTHWVTHHTTHEPQIHRDWFRDTCHDTMVPVYWNHHRTTTTATINTSDDRNPTDGRVMECPKQHMTIQEYLMHPCFDNQHDDDDDDDDDECDNATKNNQGVPYLKDWHFQFWYEQQSSSPQTEFIYTLPDFLPYDLLNGFLLRFDPLATVSSLSSSSSLSFKNHDITKVEPHHDQHHNEMLGESEQSLYNDYRFVYWGPRHSSTDMHTDVLLSLSWSYNVCGTKLWTFYIPTANHPHHTDHPNETVVSIEQKMGELIIVPSGIRHSVTNQQETLSINHNWITTDILPRVWQCIRSEMIAVDEELSAWGTTYRVTCYHARESMLRACVGLNVSLYFFMVLTRGIDLYQHAAAVAPPPPKQIRRSDLIHIRNALQQILDDPTVHLSDRLAATLQNDASSAQAIRTGMDCVKAITRVVGT